MPGHNKPVNLSGQEMVRLAQFRLMAEEQIQRLGRAIRKRREDLELSMPQLAAKLPVDPKTIERWELAKTGGAMDNLSQIAKALNTTVDDLLAQSLKRPEQSETPDVLGQLGDRAILQEIRRDIKGILRRLDAAAAAEAARAAGGSPEGGSRQPKPSDREPDEGQSASGETPPAE